MKINLGQCECVCVYQDSEEVQRNTTEVKNVIMRVFVKEFAKKCRSSVENNFVKIEWSAIDHNFDIRQLLRIEMLNEWIGSNTRSNQE
jgi:hypothetical protein